MAERTVVILSGGLDSTTCLGIAHERGAELFTLTFRYGQRHSREVEQAEKIAQFYQVKAHRLVDLHFLQEIGGSALTDGREEIPDAGQERGIPSTYVPARNLIFLSLATAYAEVIGAEKIMIGISDVDYSGYPDCRPEFINSMSHTIRLATKAGDEGGSIQIEAPLLGLSKGETIRKGMQLGVPYHLTTSCYRGEKLACGRCDSCQLRIKGFKDAGFRDPIPYAISIDW